MSSEDHIDTSDEARESRKDAFGLIAVRKSDTADAYNVELRRVFGDADARARQILVDNLTLIASSAIWMVADEEGVDDLEIMHRLERAIDELSDKA